MWYTITVNLINIIGLGLTAYGAFISAKSGIISEDEAIDIGLAKYAPTSKEEQLKMPAVLALTETSKKLKSGLYIICFGTGLQIIISFLNLFFA